jgi:SagB-type dehydrogenase family enzyme
MHQLKNVAKKLILSKKLITPAILLILGLVLVTAGVLFFGPKPVNHFSFKNSPQKEKEVALPQPRYQSQLSVEEALLKRRSVREYEDKPLNLFEISQLLWAAQGITEPQTDKRTAPSAGALYPLKVYVMGQIEDLTIGMYQYNPYNHSLIKIGDKDLKKELAKGTYDQIWIEKAPVNLIFTGNYEIIAKKYGKEKAPRYTHMEVGHAAQNVYLQAESLNLGTVTVGGFEIEKVKEILDLATEEEPLYIMPVGKRQK